MTMLRIGLLGASGIAPEAIIRPAARRSDATVDAVAGRDSARAAAYATEHGIARSYGDYRDLLADPQIDLVYNALPASLHAEWSIAALEAGKHVLCEKPFAMNADEARRMRDAADATGLRLIEAFHDRYHPLSADVDELYASGRLGEIVSVRAEFSSAHPFDPISIRHDPEVGGGALMDLGCYPVHWVRALFGTEPTVTSASAVLNPLGADTVLEAELLFPGGATAQIVCSMDAPDLLCSMDIVGTLGTAHIENPVFPSKGHYVVERIDGLPREHTVAGLQTYDHQLEAVIAGLASGEQLLTEGEDSVANMRVIDAMYEAAGFDRSL